MHSQSPLKVDAEEVQSSWNHKLYRVNDFLYEVDNGNKKQEGRIYCRCIRKKKDCCLARVIIEVVRECQFICAEFLALSVVLNILCCFWSLIDPYPPL